MQSVFAVQLHEVEGDRGLRVIILYRWIHTTPYKEASCNPEELGMCVK